MVVQPHNYHCPKSRAFWHLSYLGGALPCAVLCCAVMQELPLHATHTMTSSCEPQAAPAAAAAAAVARPHILTLRDVDSVQAGAAGAKEQDVPFKFLDLAAVLVLRNSVALCNGVVDPCHCDKCWATGVALQPREMPAYAGLPLSDMQPHLSCSCLLIDVSPMPGPCDVT